MHRIDSDGSVNGLFSEGNPSLGVEGTKVTADWLNDIQEGLIYLIESAGLVPEKGNHALIANAILEAVQGGNFSSLDTRITNLNSSYLYGARNVFRQDDEPDEGTQGPFYDNDIWIETDINPEKIWLWNSITDTWVDTTNESTGRGILAAQKAQAIADGVVQIFVQVDTPSGASEGDIWYNDRDDLLFLFDAGVWNRVYDDASKNKIVNSIINNASKTAQGTADSKILTFYTADAPSGLTELNDGDLWFDIDNGNKLYRYSHPSWTEVQDEGISRALDYIILQGAIADGSIFVYFSDVEPNTSNQAALNPPNPAPSEGDVWIDITDVGGSPRNYAYLYQNNIWVRQNDPEFEALLLSFATSRAIQDGAVTIYFSETEPDNTFIPAPRYGDIWFDTSSVTIDDPDAADPESDPQISVPKWEQYRYDGTDWVLIEDFKLKIVEANLKIEQLARTEENQAISGQLTTAVTRIDDNTATVQQSLLSINGIAGSYGVRTNINNEIVGFGFITDYEREIEFTKTGTKDFNPGDIVFIGADYVSKTYEAVIVSVDNVNGTMRVISETGTFATSVTVTAKDRLDANATIDTGTLNPTPGTSEFEIIVDKFKITDGSTSTTPFSISNGVIYVGAMDISNPQVTYIGDFSSDPDTTYTINSIYKNTTNGNSYILEYISGNSGPKQWVIFLERGNNARSLIMTSNSPGYIFDSNVTSTPSNTAIRVSVQYQGQLSAIDATDITVKDSGGSTLSPTLTNSSSDDTLDNDSGGQTHRGKFSFDINYADFSTGDFPITIEVDDGTISDEIELVRLVGSTAKTLSINPDSFVFLFEDDVATDPSNTSIQFRIQHQSLSSAPTSSEVTIEDADSTSYSPTNFISAASGSGVSSFELLWSTVSSATFPITINVTDEGITDVVTIRELISGIDAVSGFLTNESHLVPADELGTIESGGLDGAVGIFDVYQGATKKNQETTYTVSSTVGCTATIDDTATASAGEYEITALSANKATATFQAVFGTTTIQKVMSLTKSVAGVNARAIRLFATSQTFDFNGDDQPVNPSDSITLTTIRTEVSGVTWTAVDENDDPVALSGSGDDTRTLSIGNFGDALETTITVSATYNSVTYTDKIRVVRLREGSNAVQVILSNENHTYTADENGTISSGDFDTGNTDITVFRGTESISYNATPTNNTFRIGTITASTGTTIDNTEVKPTVGISGLTNLFGYIDVPVIYRNNAGIDSTYTRRISYSKSVEGEKGRSLQLFGTDQVFRFDGDEQAIDSGDTITVTAFAQNLGTRTFSAADENDDPITLTGSGDSRTLSISNFGSSNVVTITCEADYTVDGSTETVTDKFSIYRINGAIRTVNVILTNEAHTYFAGPDGSIDAGLFDSGNTLVRVFRGSEEISYNAGAGTNTFRFGTIVADNCTIDNTETSPTIGISSLTDDSGTLTVPVIYKDPNGNEETFTKIISYTKAKVGAQARGLRMSATSQIFRFDGDNIPLDSGETVTFTTQRTLLGTAPTWAAIDHLGNPITLGVVDDDTRTLSISNFGGSEWVRVSAEITTNIDGNDVTYRDEITAVRLTRGLDAVAVLIENESHNFPADEYGVVSDYSSGNTVVRVFLGDTEKFYGTSNDQFRFGTTTQTNVTKNSGLTPPNIGVSAMSDNTGKIRIPVIYKDINGNDRTVYKEISYTKSLAGTAARNLRLFAEKLVFEFDNEDQEINPSDTITFTAVATNVTSLSFSAVDQNDNPVTLTGSGNQRILSIGNFDDSLSVKVTVTGSSVVSGNTVNYSDEITILRLREGAGGIQVALTNESHTFYADEENAVLPAEYSGGNSTIKVYSGINEISYNVTPTNNTWRLGTVTETNVTRNGSLSLPVVGISAFDQSSNSGSLELDVIYRDLNGIDRTVPRSVTYSKSKAGTDARALRIISTSQLFNFDTEGDPIDNADEITLTAVRQFIDGAAVWTATDENDNPISLTPGANGDEKILSIGNFGTALAAVIVLEATDSFTGETLTDRITIYRLNQGAEGKDGVTVSITNDNHTFNADENGNVADYSSGNTSVSVFSGSTVINYSATKVNNTFRFGTAVLTNITRNVGLSEPIVGISAMSDDVGTMVLPVIYTDNQGTDLTFNKTLTYSKARAGVNVKNIRLISSGLTFEFDQFGDPIDTDQVVTFTAFRTNIPSVTWTAVDENDNPISFTSGTGDSRTLDIDDFGDINEVTITISATSESVTYTDTSRIVRLERARDAVSIVGTNENHTFYADEAGVISSGDFAGGNCTFAVYHGTVSISYNATPTNNTWRFGSIVADSVTLNASLTGGETGISAMSADTGSLTTPIIYRDKDGIDQTFTRNISYTKARNGRDARWVRLSPSEQVFRFTGDDLPLDNSQTIDLVLSYNLVSLGDITVTAKDENDDAITLGGSGANRTLTISNFGNSEYVVVEAIANITVQGQAQVIKDQVTLSRVQDGSGVFQAILTNEAHTFAADEDGLVDSYTGGNSLIRVFRGGEEIDYQSSVGNNKFRLGTATVSNVTQNGGLSEPTVGISAMSDDFGTLTIPVIYRDPTGSDSTINKVISYSKSRSGEKARLLRLFATAQIFGFDSENNPVSPTDEITLNAISTNLGVPTWTVKDKDGDAVVGLLNNGANGYEKTIDINDFDYEFVTVEISATHNSTTYTDTVSVHKVREGSSNLSIISTNEAHTFGADEEGTVVDFSGGTSTIKLFKGTTEISYDGSGSPANNTWKFNGTPTATDITYNAGSFPDIVITAMAEDVASISFTVDYKDQDGVISTVTGKTLSYTKSRAGVNARNLRLLSSALQFNFDANDSPLNGSASITFEAIKTYIPESVSFTAVDQDSVSVTLTGSGNNRTLSVANFDDADYVDVTATVTNTVNSIPTVYSDTVRVVKVRDGASGLIGKDSLQVFLTNPQTTFAIDKNGNMVEDYSVGDTAVEVYLGTTSVSYSGTTTSNTWRFGTITETSVEQYQSGSTIGIRDMFADQGSLAVQIIYRDSDAQDTTFNRVINYTKARSGITDREFYITPSKHTFAFDGDNNPKNGSDSITVDLVRSDSISVPIWSADPSITLSNGSSDDQKIITIANYGSNENVTVTARSSLGEPVYSNNYNYGFKTLDQGWQTNGFISATFNDGWQFEIDGGVDSNSYIFKDYSGSEQFDGGDYRYAAVVIEILSSNDSGQKRLYWKNSGHGYSNSYFSTANVQDSNLTNTGLHTLIFDLHNPTTGTSDDFSSNTITGLRFDAFGTGQATYKVHRIGLANDVRYFEDSFTIARIVEGTDNIQIIGTNENHTYKATEDGTLEDVLSTGQCDFKIYRGSNLITYSGTTTNNTWRFTGLSVLSGSISAGYTAGGGVLPSALSTDSATLEVSITYRDPNGSDTTFTRVLSYSKARQGILARTLKITASSLVFAFDQDGSPKDAGDTITFDATGLNMSTPFTWSAVDEESANVTLTTVDSDTRTLSISNFGTSNRVTVTVSKTVNIDGSNETFTDSVTVGRIQDASANIQVFPTNESHTFFANEDGFVVDYTGGDSTFIVYRGLEQISFQSSAANNKWRYGNITAVGIEDTVSGDTISFKNMTTTSAIVDVQIIYRDPTGQDYTYTQQLSFAKAIQGYTGVNGVSIFQTNPTHTFTTDQSGTLLSGQNYNDGNSTFSVYAGDEELVYSSFPKVNSFRIDSVSTLNVTRDSGETLPTVGISAMSADTGKLTTNIIAHPATTRVYNFGFEKGADGVQTSSGPDGWLYSGSTNNVGYNTIVDVDSNFDSSLSWGAQDNDDPFGGCGWYKVGKRFGVTGTPTFITIKSKIRSYAMTVPSSFSGTASETYMSEGDCFAEVIFKNGSNVQIGSTEYSISQSHKQLNNGLGGQSLNNQWQLFEHTFDVPANTEIIEIYLVSSDGTDAVRALGYLSGNSGVLFDDVVFECDSAIYDITREQVITQSTSYSKAKTGENSIVYRIVPTNGSAIKNGSGALTGELRKIDGPSETTVTTGDVKLYKDGVLITSPTNYSYSLNAAAITGSTVISAKDGSTTYDTVTLADIADALGAGYIEADNGYVMSRVNSESTTISPSTSTLTGTFYRAGDVTTPYTRQARVEGRVSGGNLQLRWVALSGSGDITSTVTRDNGSSANSGTWYTTTSLTVEFEFDDPISGGTAKVAESVYIISAGARGSRQFYATGSSWSDSTANSAITAQGLTPVLGDVVTISNSGTGFSQTRFYDGANWIQVTQVIDGNLVVQGTLAADRLATGLVQSANIQIGSPRFSINGANENLTIQDENSVTRVKIGDLGSGATAYGIEIRDASNNLVLSSGGVDTSFLSGNIDWGTLASIPSGVTGAATAMNSSGQLDWGKVIGSLRPEDGATKSRTYRQSSAPSSPTTNDIWFDTDVNKTYRWSGSSWQEIGNNFNNTNQLTDGASLGSTAVWNNVTGSGKPDDDATVGAIAGTNLTDHLGNPVSTMGDFARLVGQLSSGNISTYIASAAIGTALIQNAAITNALIANLAVDDAKINNVSAGKITAGTIDVNVNIGSANIKLDGANNRILISD